MHDIFAIIIDMNNMNSVGVFKSTDEAGIKGNCAGGKIGAEINSSHY